MTFFVLCYCLHLINVEMTNVQKNSMTRSSAPRTLSNTSHTVITLKAIVQEIDVPRGLPGGGRC